MPAAEGTPTREPVRGGRCRCGHYAGSHMRVVPVGALGAGGYRLEPSGPCAVCGAEACARLQPLPAGESPR